ncbi:AAA family ATPase [Sagittula stellata]|uniref:MoxR-like ATPase n=1 Tax=Sagittula stellata (strain ATCC 700073 / DSM 11524 / E-37) TaxID=388399 RepID=A3K874_SAGS3|nr:AAA family ATPase [Sagittula stellata]EBA06553.1 MoxR-like ATPase [Sagittula stellata E-37]
MEDQAPGGSLTEAAQRLTQRMEAGLIGQSALVERLVICLLTGGHVLIEGPPGLAKTRSVRRLSDAVEGSFARIQCTPDLMPSDVTGTQAWRQESGQMVFLPGPVFHSLVLVDEINRAPPKVQSALLEAMAEGQVTSGGLSRALPEPFMVVATQNPLEQEGTFPLPEAQLDRFLFHVLLDLPDEATELAILDLVEGELRAPAGQAVSCLDTAKLAAMKAEVVQVHLSPALRRYIVGLVMATRTGVDGLSVTDRIQHAVSPRGTLSLAAAARARAWLNGRDYAVPEDVEALAPDVLCHRMAPTWRARAAGETSRGIMTEILSTVEPL